MEYRQIVAVTGLGGLYQLMSTKNDGAIVRSLIDKSVKFVSARIHHITPLESIEIYTTGDNVRLHEVLSKIKNDDSEVKNLNSKKDDKAIKTYFKTILPEFDEDRVYTSDIKKVLKWYEILKANELLDFEYLTNPVVAEETVLPQEIATEAVVEAVIAQQPIETKPKKTATKKESTVEVGSDGEKPAKKVAAKKKATETGEEKPIKKATPRKKKEEQQDEQN